MHYYSLIIIFETFLKSWKDVFVFSLSNFLYHNCPSPPRRSQSHRPRRESARKPHRILAGADHTYPPLTPCRRRRRWRGIRRTRTTTSSSTPHPLPGTGKPPRRHAAASAGASTDGTSSPSPSLSSSSSTCPSTSAPASAFSAAATRPGAGGGVQRALLAPKPAAGGSFACGIGATDTARASRRMPRIFRSMRSDPLWLIRLSSTKRYNGRFCFPTRLGLGMYRSWSTAV